MTRVSLRVLGLVSCVVPATASAQLRITEIMYNPFATNEFEWIEVYNPSTTSVDLSGWVFARDLNQNPANGANILTGSIPAQSTAVLIRTDTSGGRVLEGYEVAWERASNPQINFVPIPRWPGLPNITSTTSVAGLGLWPSLAAYQTDVNTTFQDPSNPVYTYDNAATFVRYGNGGNWPQTDITNTNDGPSIYLANINADVNVGQYWRLSTAGQDRAYTGGSGTIVVNGSNVNINRTRDIGSPGFVPILGDFDRDGDRDATDIDLLLQTAPTGPTPPADVVFDVRTDRTIVSTPGAADSDADFWVETLAGTRYGDANLDRRIDFTDLLALASSYGQSGTGWASGNFNGTDGTNFSDLLTLAGNYGFGALSDGERSQLDGAFLSDFALATALVPEPSIALFGSAGAMLVLRRRSSGR